MQINKSIEEFKIQIEEEDQLENENEFGFGRPGTEESSSGLSAGMTRWQKTVKKEKEKAKAAYYPGKEKINRNIKVI